MTVSFAGSRSGALVTLDAGREKFTPCLAIYAGFTRGILSPYSRLSTNLTMARNNAKTNNNKHRHSASPDDDDDDDVTYCAIQLDGCEMLGNARSAPVKEHNYKLDDTRERKRASRPIKILTFKYVTEFTNEMCHRADAGAANWSQP
ncbi:hypothetical protein PUN28_017316 [Cardiocondyla obscurior]|uniref:Uncharacterized protein n=1 Tax=Cardiocondyla obscurior TaxID=286306 RepID=A0AAW2EQA2_9HYME